MTAKSAQPDRNAGAQPPAVLGVLGGGQLGMLFAQAAQTLGLRVESFSPEASPPVAQAVAQHHSADYTDAGAVEAFGRRCAAISYEFENVPVSAAEVCERVSRLRPSSRVLRVCQDRLVEKSFLQKHDLATPAFAGADSLAGLREAMVEVGLPAVVKTARGGYDGRGQRVVRRVEDAEYAWAELGGGAGMSCIVEAFVGFDRELSVVVARSVDGAVEAFGPIHNVHRNHVLDLSVYPAGLPEQTAEAARALARGVAEALDLVGVIAVELFHEPGDVLKVNELAPRPHNSGHLSIEACAVSQFTQQVLAVSGNSVRPFAPHGSSAMVNLMGELWSDGTPDWSAAQADPNAFVHLYGKAQARPGRKMGHLTVLGDTPQAAVERAAGLRRQAAPWAFQLASDGGPDRGIEAAPGG